MSSYPSGWRAVSLGDSGRWLSGGTPSTSNGEYWDGEIPWISAKSLTEFRLYDSDRRVTTLGAMNGTRLVDAETILMVVRGMSLKSEFRIGIAQRQLTFGQDCKALIARQGIDPQFLAYAIRAKTPQILGIVDEAGHGTGRLNTDQLYGVEIGLPSHAEQRVIADVLGALDDKIEANRKLADTADALAAATVRAVQEVGRVDRLGDVAEIVMGSSPSGATMNEDGDGVPFYQGVRDFGLRFPTRRVWTTSPVRTAREGDVLVSVRAPVGTVNYAPESLCIGRGLAAVRSTIGQQATLFHLLRAARREWAEYDSGGTVFGSINRDQIHNIEIPSIRSDDAVRCEATVHRVEQRLGAALRENERLAVLRDTLLPKLMSGRLRVAEAMEMVSS